MSRFINRYATAMHSSHLAQNPEKEVDVDILGAMGFAAKNFPISAYLTRMFLGDHSVERQLRQCIAEVAINRSRTNGKELKRQEATLLASQVVMFLRNKRCTHCGGHGKHLIPGTRTLGDQECAVCRGTGLRNPKAIFGHHHGLGLDLVGWVEGEASRASGVAMRTLAPSLEL